MKLFVSEILVDGSGDLAAGGHGTDNEAGPADGIAGGEEVGVGYLVGDRIDGDVTACVDGKGKFFDEAFLLGMYETHRKKDEVGFDHFRAASLAHFRSAFLFGRLPFYLFDFDTFQGVLISDEADGSEVPATDASFFMTAACFQYLRI